MSAISPLCRLLANDSITAIEALGASPADPSEEGTEVTASLSLIQRFQRLLLSKLLTTGNGDTTPKQTSSCKYFGF